MNFCTKIGRIDWGRAGTRSGEWPEKVSKWAIAHFNFNFNMRQKLQYLKIIRLVAVYI